MSTNTLLLLTPSHGLGGGIERVSAAVEEQWNGPCVRLDLVNDHAPANGRTASAKVQFSWRAVRLARRAGADVVLAIHVGLLPVARAAAVAAGARLAVLGIGREVWSTIDWGRRKLIQRSDALIAISNFTADRLAERAQVPRARIDVVPLPVAASLLSLARRGSACAFERHARLITVSRIDSNDRYKGHFAIADALPAVLEKQSDLRWIVVGHGEGLPMLRAHCESLRVDHAVDFEGRVSDAHLASLYQTSSAFVMPSVTNLGNGELTGEGFGLVYSEAAAFGLPSIASTSCGGAADFVIDDVTALTVRPHDKTGLAEAMVRLVQDTQLRDRLGTAARERVAAHHTPEHFAATLNAALARHTDGGSSA